MIYIAPDVFYYWLSDDPEYGERATEIIASIERKTKAATSVQTLVELDRQFAEVPNYSFSELFMRMGALKYLKLIKLEDDTLEDAIDAMGLYSLPLEPAVHFTTAKDARCETFFSTDPVYENTPLKITHLAPAPDA